jgi:hypothetical protein
VSLHVALASSHGVCAVGCCSEPLAQLQHTSSLARRGAVCCKRLPATRHQHCLPSCKREHQLIRPTRCCRWRILAGLTRRCWSCAVALRLSQLTRLTFSAWVGDNSPLSGSNRVPIPDHLVDSLLTTLGCCARCNSALFLHFWKFSKRTVTRVQLPQTILALWTSSSLAVAERVRVCVVGCCRNSFGCVSLRA